MSKKPMSHSQNLQDAIDLVDSVKGKIPVRSLPPSANRTPAAACASGRRSVQASRLSPKRART